MPKGIQKKIVEKFPVEISTGISDEIPEGILDGNPGDIFKEIP